MIEVVIPAHNAAPFLREALESAAAQTRPPALVTVVDDRSTDGTREAAERAARGLPVPVRVLPTEGPPGPSAARNTAIRRADGPPLVALLDADDLLLPGHHAALAGLLEAAPGAALAFGDTALFDAATGRTLLDSHHAATRLLDLPADPVPGGPRGGAATTAAGGGDGWTLGGAGFRHLLREPRVPTSACLFPRAAALRAGLFDEAMMFAEDWDFFLRLALLGDLVFVRSRVGRKRVHAGNLSHPRNRVRFMGGAARLAARLDAIADGRGAPPIRVGGRDREAIRRNLPRAFDGWLYEASLSGLADYAEAARHAARAGHGGLACRPRHAARLWRTLAFGPPRAPPPQFGAAPKDPASGAKREARDAEIDRFS